MRPTARPEVPRAEAAPDEAEAARLVGVEARSVSARAPVRAEPAVAQLMGRSAFVTARARVRP